MRHQDHRSPPPASGPPTPPAAWWRISPRLPPRLSRRSPSIFMEAQVQVTQRGSGRAWPCHQHRVRVLVRVSREIVSQCGGQAAQPCPPVRAPRSSCTCRCWSSNLQAGRRLVSCGGADHTKGGGKVAKEGTGSTDLEALEKMRLGFVASPPHRHIDLKLQNWCRCLLAHCRSGPRAGSPRGVVSSRLGSAVAELGVVQRDDSRPLRVVRHERRSCALEEAAERNELRQPHVVIPTQVWVGSKLRDTARNAASSSM